jgi:hypothetical protein
VHFTIKEELLEGFYRHRKATDVGEIAWLVDVLRVQDLVSGGVEGRLEVFETARKASQLTENV